MLETQFKLIKMIKGDILTQITKNSKDLSLSLILLYVKMMEPENISTGRNFKGEIKVLM